MDRLVIEFRVLFWAILGVIVPFGFLLYFFPSSTDSYWAWTIPQPRSAMLIGAGYVGAIAYYVILLRENDWQQTRNGMGGLIIFCTVLLVATMVHWKAFKPYHFTTLVWLMFYYVGPFLVPIISRLQGNLTSPSELVTASIKGTWRVWLIVRGLLYMVVSILIFIMSEGVADRWPWEIDPLDLRVFTGQIAIVGWTAVGALKGNASWRRLRLGLTLTLAIGVVQLAGLAVGPGEYRWTVSGILLAVLFLEWVATPFFAWLSFRRSQ